jgi:hypothetical protein
MTAALRKIDSPQPRRVRQRVAAQNSSKVTYLPHVSPHRPSVSTKPLSANSRRSQRLQSERKERSRSPQSNPWATPMWLRSLQGTNTAIAIATFVLVSAVMGAYSQVVYTKQNWGQEYRQLERLQKEERQMTAFNEALKNDIAQTAKQEGTGLIIPDANSMIVLEPTSVRPLQPDSSAQRESFQTQQPLGY